MRYDICSTFYNSCPFLKRFKNYPVLGVYSSILALYLYCHVAREETAGYTKKKIIFYALCVLYLLSVVVFVLDILVFIVSNKLFFF